MLQTLAAILNKVQKLAADYTAARAAKLDNLDRLDANISSRFPRVNTPKIVQGNPNSETNVTLVSVSGGSGYLLGISAVVMTATSTTLYATIQADGVTFITDAVVGRYDPGDFGSTNPIFGPLYFGSSLVVQGKESSATASSRFLISYCLASPQKEKIAEWEEIEEDLYIVRKYKVEEVFTFAGNVVTIKSLQETNLKTKILCIGPSEVAVGTPATFRVEYRDWQDNSLPDENRPIQISVVGPGQAQKLVLTPTNGQAEFNFISETSGTFKIRVTTEFPCDLAEIEVVVL